MSAERKDMTSGKILPQLIKFALPLLGASLIQQLYNTADMLFVGNFAGKTGAAAVGSSGLIFTCLIGLFTGISVGVGILISQYWGAGDIKSAKKTAQTAMVVGTIGSVLLMMIGLFLAKSMLMLLRTPEDILEEAAVYVRIYFLSMVPMVLYNMGSSILRAEGNSKVPFYILIAGGFTNIVTDALFVAVLRWGSVGAAVATSISQTVSAVCIVVYLTSEKRTLRVNLRDWSVDKGLLFKILNYGLPSGVQSMMLTLSNVVVQYYINGYGTDATAAFAAYFKIEGIIYYPIMAMGQAMMTFSGQNYGSGKIDRIRKGNWQGVGMSIVLAAVTAVLVLLFPANIMRMFIRDEAVVNYGVIVLRTTFPLYWIYSILELTGASLRGMGYAKTSMAVVLSTQCGLRVLILFLMGLYGATVRVMATVYPITWAAAAIGFVIFFLYRTAVEVKKMDASM